MAKELKKENRPCMQGKDCEFFYVCDNEGWYENSPCLWEEKEGSDADDEQC